MVSGIGMHRVVPGVTIQVESPLVGRHQLRNVALAIAAAEELHNQGTVQITAATIAQGLRQHPLARALSGGAAHGRHS